MVLIEKGLVDRGPYVPPASHLIINSLADFTIQDADTVTIPDGKKVIVGGSVDIGARRVIVGTSCSWDGGSSGNGNKLISSTTGDLFTGVDFAEFKITNVGLQAPQANQLYNFSDTVPGTSTFIIDNFAIYAENQSAPSANKFGTFTDLDILNIGTGNALTSTSGLALDDGITIEGSLNVLTIDKVRLGSIASTTYVGLDLTDAIINSFAGIDDFINVGIAAGSVGIKGLADSGNLAETVHGSISSCAFVGAITPLSGIAHTDIQWEIDDSAPVENSTKDAFTYMAVDRVVPVATAGVFYPIAGGDWSEVVANRFETDVDGIMTYTGFTPTDVKIDGSASVAKDGGGSDVILVRINIDTGSGFPAVPPERTEDSTESANPTSVSPKDLYRISPGDRVQMWVANQDGTADILVKKSAKLIIVNGF